ncbi:MAG: arabinan endo-1,5-alpha-L-arabinosidase [Opitutales bacterium]|nr:arabinan endo-1,5-alpha-L-arabinosidase [Opitutales bacterium]
MSTPRRHRSLFAFMLSGLTLTATAFGQQGDVTHVHDPAIIKENGTYYIFSTGHGVPIRSSSDLKNWELSGRIFENEAVPEWTAEMIPGTRFPWAPDVSYFNGRFHVYYSISTFGSQRSVIGLATSPTLDPESPDYQWTDHGMVIDSKPERDSFNAIDANLIMDSDGNPWLNWGSFHWRDTTPGGIMIQALDKESGKPKEGSEAIHIAGRPEQRSIEAPFIIRANDAYYLFVSFDHCCRGVDSTYRIMVGRSESITGPYVDHEGRPMTEGNAYEVLAGDGNRVIGPGHNSVLKDGDRHYLVHHFYDAENEGIPTLQIRPMSWDDEGWPIAGEPL